MPRKKWKRSASKCKVLEDKSYADIDPLYLSMNDGTRVDNEFGTEALENTFRELKEKYPEINYQIYIAYEYSDEHGSGVINYEISSDSNATSSYDFLESKLSFALEILEDEF